MNNAILKKLKAMEERKLIDEETEKRHQEFLDYIQYLIDHPQPNRKLSLGANLSSESLRAFGVITHQRFMGNNPRREKKSLSPCFLIENGI